MKIPRRIKEILDTKADIIAAANEKLQKEIIRNQSALLNEFMSEIIPMLDIRDGVIIDTTHNYRVLSSIEKMLNDFFREYAKKMAGLIIEATSAIGVLSTDYFQISLRGEISASFEKIISSTTRKINLRLGVENGRIVGGGFLDSYLKDTSIGNTLKNYMSKAITGQINTKEFISGVSGIIGGRDGGPGALEKQMNRFAHDLYMQYDSAYNVSMAEELDLQYFIYHGTLVGDSRDFCAAHQGKVWSREEAKTWKEWTPAKGEYPPGWEIKQKDLYAVPSYMNYPGYEPLIDRGGYNCRHQLGFISNEMAENLRPGLKKNKMNY